MSTIFFDAEEIRGVVEFSTRASELFRSEPAVTNYKSRRHRQSYRCQYHLGKAPDPSVRVVPRVFLGGSSDDYGSRSAFRLYLMDQIPLNDLPSSDGICDSQRSLVVHATNDLQVKNLNVDTEGIRRSDSSSPEVNSVVVISDVCFIDGRGALYLFHHGVRSEAAGAVAFNFRIFVAKFLSLS